MPVIQAELRRAERVLFGIRLSAEGGLAARLTADKLKRQYRRRLFESHPDRSVQLGISAVELRRRFEDVVWAYRTLSASLQPRRQPRPAHPAPPPTTAPTTADQRRTVYYRGPMPPRPLLIGQFAYYSGRIPWPALVAAISWQRQQRPVIGALAVGLGLLTPQQVRRLLTSRHAEAATDVRFAEYARRKGALSLFQQLAVVGRQRSLHQPFGHFFVERRLLTERELEELISALRLHNWRHSRRA